MKYVFSYPLLTALSHRYFTHRHTWEDAEKDCREHSAHLSSVISATEQEFINGVCVCVCVSVINKLHVTHLCKYSPNKTNTGDTMNVSGCTETFVYSETKDIK